MYKVGDIVKIKNNPEYEGQVFSESEIFLQIRWLKFGKFHCLYTYPKRDLLRKSYSSFYVERQKSKLTKQDCM